MLEERRPISHLKELMVRVFGSGLIRHLGLLLIRHTVTPGHEESNDGTSSAKCQTEAEAYSGFEPLTPDDIAEIITFTAGRRENVVVADTLIFPNHQAAATIMHRKS